MKKLLLFLNILIFGSLIFQANGIKLAGGGVLPVGKIKKRTLFLFSREAFGPDKGKYADFGGKADKKDHNKADRISAREAWEEGPGVFNSQSGLQNYLKHGSKKNVRRVIDPKYRYAEYFARIKFDPQINSKFLKARAKVKSFHRREKDKLIWVPRHKLMKALSNNNNNINVNGQNIRLRAFTFALLRKNQALLKSL